jgi:hypothetical protein
MTTGIVAIVTNIQPDRVVVTVSIGAILFPSENPKQMVPWNPSLAHRMRKAGAPGSIAPSLHRYGWSFWADERVGGSDLNEQA